ncbi:hypothetical protein MKW94_022866, partial [Papaver nudicaule]|nr:hypothetical protein [Papaver nudicaule]
MFAAQNEKQMVQEGALKALVSVVDSLQSGLLSKSQELTTLFLSVRFYCSFVMKGDIHTVLDFMTLVPTAWVIYMIRFKLKSTYIDELDNFKIYYLVIPCAILSIFIHPSNRMCWALRVFLESISVLPQLHLMQNAKVQTLLYAFSIYNTLRFALGIARFLGCAHWIIQ